jgi:peptidoglycan/LPS O-acetylase OafA/YrhL
MSQISRIPALDGVRGLATLLVLSSHFLFVDVYGARWWWAAAHAGFTGVDMFFVLSGFLITSILIKTKGRADYFREFYRRRVLRIFPLYYAVLLFSMFAILVIDRKPENLWKGYDSLAWFFAFIPNFAIAYKNDPVHWVWQTNWAGLNHLWSLAVEEQFYLLWPLIVWLLPVRVLVPVCVGLLISGSWLRTLTDAQFGTPWSLASYMLPYCRMDGLAGGSLLALLVQGGWLRWGRVERSLIRDATFLGLVGILYWLVAEDSQVRGTITAFTFVGFVYLAMCEGSWVQRLCKLPFLRHIGMYSYGLYVFHQLFFMVYKWILRDPLEASGLPMPLVQGLYMLGAFGITYALARLSWRFVEKPFLDMK